MKITALAGGVGGAKLADGLYRILAPGDLTVIVNTGDDFTHLGLKISPDLDTVCYTLANKANPATGWGLAGESFQVLESLKEIGAPSWFRVGDKDLGTHLYRTHRLLEGVSLSEITHTLCAAWKVSATVLPMSDDPVATIIHTSEVGDLSFQEYFVHQQCKPAVTGFSFVGADAAVPAPGVLEAIDQADAIVICPSNPWVSIAPILSIRGVRNRLYKKSVVVAVSPLIAGQALKGPAAKMFSELGWQPSAHSVANQYMEIISHFILDFADQDDCEAIRQWGIIPYVTDIFMKDIPGRIRLAKYIIDQLSTYLGGNQPS